MSIPTIALVPPKPRLSIPARRVNVATCPACNHPLQYGDNCRCND